MSSHIWFKNTLFLYLINAIDFNKDTTVWTLVVPEIFLLFMKSLQIFLSNL